MCLQGSGGEGQGDISPEGDTREGREMTVIPYELPPSYIETRIRNKVYRMQTWKLVDARTGRTRAEMTNPADVDAVIEAIILADLMRQNCAAIGIFEAEMIERSCFED